MQYRSLQVESRREIMGQKYSELTPEHRTFISAQRIFFVATAAPDGRVNTSPKGMDSLRLLSNTRLVWLNVTGSGNETAAHVQIHPRMTLMFCAFEGPPKILRLYGTARVIHPRDDDWQHFCNILPAHPGARQIFDLTIDLVQTSCGMAVPHYHYEGEREQLSRWAEGQGPEGIRDYWSRKNQSSLDGLPTGIFDDVPPPEPPSL